MEPAQGASSFTTAHDNPPPQPWSLSTAEEHLIKGIDEIAASILSLASHNHDADELEELKLEIVQAKQRFKESGCSTSSAIKDVADPALALSSLGIDNDFIEKELDPIAASTVNKLSDSTSPDELEQLELGLEQLKSEILQIHNRRNDYRTVVYTLLDRVRSKLPKTNATAEDSLEPEEEKPLDRSGSHPSKANAATEPSLEPEKEKPLKSPGLQRSQAGTITDSFSDPARFKNSLLSSLTDQSAVGDILELHNWHDNRTFVYLLPDSQTYYTMLSSPTVFGGPESDSEEDDDAEDHSSNDSIYWCLRHGGKGWFAAPKGKHGVAYADEAGNERESSFWVANADEGDVFLPLGWLVERNESGFHRTTRFVGALNLSTTPISFWLIFRYHAINAIWSSPSVDIASPATTYRHPKLDHAHAGASCPKSEDGAEECQTTHSSDLDQTASGYMNQPQAWDLACIYKDAVNEWPTSLEDAKRHTATPRFFGCAHAEPCQIPELPKELVARLQGIK